MIIVNKKVIDTMTNKEMLKQWEEYRKEMFHCVPDEEGNYPCDNGEMCDRCCTERAIMDFAAWNRSKKMKKYTIIVEDYAVYEFDFVGSEAEAVDMAMDWFAERIPNVKVVDIVDKK